MGFACMLRGPGIAIAPDARRDPPHDERQQERDPRRDPPDNQIPAQIIRSLPLIRRSASRDTRLAAVRSWRVACVRSALSGHRVRSTVRTVFALASLRHSDSRAVISSMRRWWRPPSNSVVSQTSQDVVGETLGHDRAPRSTARWRRCADASTRPCTGRCTTRPARRSPCSPRSARPDRCRRARSPARRARPPPPCRPPAQIGG